MGFPNRSHSTFVSVPKKPYNFTEGNLGNLGAPAGEKDKKRVKHMLFSEVIKEHEYSKTEDDNLPDV